MEFLQIAQTAQQIGGLSLLATGLLLGVRHGIDWDHIAAITDITSTTTSVEAAESQASSEPAGARVTFRRLEIRAMWLALLYAFGHAIVVFALGMLGLLIAAVGGASSQGMGIAMLIAFTIGLVISNSVVAALASTGFITSTKARPFYIAIGALTGIFSLVIGAFFAFGNGSELPDLQQLLGLGGGSGQ